MKVHRFKLIAVAAPLMMVALPVFAAKESPKAAAEPKQADDAKTAPGPRFTLEKDTVDLGEIIRGQSATGVFEIRNTGDQVLKILDAKPG